MYSGSAKNDRIFVCISSAAYGIYKLLMSRLQREISRKIKKQFGSHMTDDYIIPAIL